MSLQLIEWPDFLANSNPESAITIGVFDALHLGHRKLIDRIVSRGPNPTLFTFRENPRKRLFPENFEGNLFSLRQKLAAFESFGLKRLVLIDFSLEFSRLKGVEFLDLLEDRGRIAFMAIGSNFRCGYRQDTDAGIIKEINERKGIPTEVLSPVEDKYGPVSSSRVRSAVLSGDLKLAAALMGRNLELDLSDLETADAAPANSVYDLRSAERIVPAAGQYPVLIHPGAVAGRATLKDGKVFLSKLNGSGDPVERIEFII